MIYDDEWTCAQCKKGTPHQHFCTPQAEARTFTCKYCGAEGVNVRHICSQKLDHLKFMCLNCGAVAVEETQVCNPVAIDDPTMEHWKKVVLESSGDLSSCKVCGQPVSPPGHPCDRKLPYDCEFCGVRVESNYHVCKQMMGKFKYVCKNCGRLGIKSTDVCQPAPMP